MLNDLLEDAKDAKLEDVDGTIFNGCYVRYWTKVDDDHPDISVLQKTKVVIGTEIEDGKQKG